MFQMKDSTQKRVMHKKKGDLKEAKSQGKTKAQINPTQKTFTYKSRLNKKYETDQLRMGIKFGKEEIKKLEDEI